MTRGLLETWQRWDAVMARMPRHPSARYGENEANAMAAACRVAAEAAGMSTVVLRSALAEQRRAGVSHQDAIAVVLR